MAVKYDGYQSYDLKSHLAVIGQQAAIVYLEIPRA